MLLRCALALLLCAAIVAAEEGQAGVARSTSEMDRAIQEFKAQTASLGARADSPKRSKEMRPSGAQAWHGRLFENFRNDFLDAVPHQIVQRGGTKNVLRRNQFGFNITGPVVFPGLLEARPGTFFSFSYEGVRERISRTSTRTVPTLPERIGDFSGTVDQAGNALPIFDPASTHENPSFDPSQPVSRENLQYARTQFPGNMIPLSRLDRGMQDALALYPAPNVSVGPFFQNNFFINSPETNIANGIIGKIDHAINERQRLTFDFNYSNGLLGASRWFDNAANPGPVDTISSTRRASIDHVFTVSAQTINTTSVDVSSERWDNGDTERIFPVYQIQEYLNMGRPSPLTTNVRNNYQFSNGTSIRKGKHSLRITGQYMHFQVHSLAGRYPAGMYRFGTGLTSLPGIVNTGRSFASMLLGLPEYAERSIVTSPSYFRRDSLNFTIREQYELRKNLTLTASLQFARRTPRVEKYDRQSTIDLGCTNPANERKGALVAAGRDGIPRGFRGPLVRWDPSINISWSPGTDSKTVVRGAYSRYHAAIPIYFGQWGTQGFNGYQTFISPNVQLDPAVLVGTPMPEVALPDLRPDAANDTIADLVDMSERDPLYQSASASVERQLPASLLLTLAFAHSNGRNLLVGTGAANPNAIHPDLLSYRDMLNDEMFNRSLRPFPQFKGFELFGLYPYGQYRRTAWSARLEKRISMGLSLTASYEMARQMDDYSGPYGAQDYYNRRNEWSLTPYARPGFAQFSYVYELPVGANKPYMNYRDWRKHLVDGWSMTGTGLYASGLPLALRPQFNNTGGVITGLRVNAVPGVDPVSPSRGPFQWFNASAFDQPADFSLGDVSRTHPILRGPSAQNYDLSVNKRLPLDTDRVVEFSAAAFNFLNRADWDSPDVVIGPASAPNVNAGRILGSHGGRVIQLGLRFSF
jgi:hypothetical protein